MNPDYPADPRTTPAAGAASASSEPPDVTWGWVTGSRVRPPALPDLVARTVLSTALLVLLAGALLGQGGSGLVDIPSNSAFVSALAGVALFTDGRRAGLPALREGWRASGKALGIGMPLTMVDIALPAHYLARLDWPTAFLLSAVLSPTDPVFAAAIVGRENAPTGLRRLLNVGSGLDDGLALPFVLVFLAAASHRTAHPAEIAEGDLAPPPSPPAVRSGQATTSSDPATSPSLSPAADLVVACSTEAVASPVLPHGSPPPRRTTR